MGRLYVGLPADEHDAARRDPVGRVDVRDGPHVLDELVPRRRREDAAESARGYAAEDPRPEARRVRRLAGSVGAGRCLLVTSLNRASAVRGRRGRGRVDLRLDGESDLCPPSVTGLRGYYQAVRAGAP